VQRRAGPAAGFLLAQPGPTVARLQNALDAHRSSPAVRDPAFWRASQHWLGPLPDAPGTAVIATAVGGTPEAVTDGTTGLLVEPANPRARRRLAPPARQPTPASTARTHGRQAIFLHYTLDQQVEQTRQV
jgi:hypothetical protein